MYFSVNQMFFIRCSASDLYDEAKKIWAEKHERNEMLYERHNTAPDDVRYQNKVRKNHSYFY